MILGVEGHMVNFSSLEVILLKLTILHRYGDIKSVFDEGFLVGDFWSRAS